MNNTQVLTGSKRQRVMSSDRIQAGRDRHTAFTSEPLPLGQSSTRSGSTATPPSLGKPWKHLSRPRESWQTGLAAAFLVHPFGQEAGASVPFSGRSQRHLGGVHANPCVSPVSAEGGKA